MDGRTTATGKSAPSVWTTFSATDLVKAYVLGQSPMILKSFDLVFGRTDEIVSKILTWG